MTFWKYIYLPLLSGDDYYTHIFYRLLYTAKTRNRSVPPIILPTFHKFWQTLYCVYTYDKHFLNPQLSNYIIRLALRTDKQLVYNGPIVNNQYLLQY